MTDTDPLAHLTSDHGNFFQLLAILDEELARVEREEQADFELLQDVMEYMTHYPDLVHHPTEDKVAEHLVARQRALEPERRRLLAEHEMLAERGGAFLRSISEVVDGALAPRASILQAGRAYVELQREHTDWEEAVLFPAARRTLGREDIEAIDDALRAERDPLFGPVRAAEYEDLWRYIARQRED